MAMTPEERRAHMRRIQGLVKAKRGRKPKGYYDAILPVEGTRTRFSRQFEEYRGHRKHTKDLIRLEIVRRHKAGEGQTEIARALGIPRTTIENWTTQSKLPVKPTSPYTLARMLALVTLARSLYRAKFSRDPRHCLWEAIRRTPGVSAGSVRVYLSMEAIPSLDGFPLYADQAVQARCCALGKGLRERGCDLFDDVTVQAGPRAVELPRSQGPTGPAPTPVVTRPGFDREKFLSGRSRLHLPRLRL